MNKAINLFTIKVIEQSTSNPLKVKRICVFVDDFLNGDTQAIYTDGEAHFVCDIDGKKRYTGKID